MALDLLLHYVLLACNVGDEAISNIMCFIRLCTVYASISLVSMSGHFPGQTSQTNNSPEQLDRCFQARHFCFNDIFLCV